MNIKKILMVDDDAYIRKVASISLRCVGHWQVLLADSASEAFRLIEEERPDVVLMDVMMPGMDGVTAFDVIRSKPQNAFLPIIFMTAKVQTTEVQSYYDLGAAGVIVKPFDPLTLPEEIESIVEAWLTVARTA